MRCESSGLGGGASGFQTGVEGFGSTQAPRTRPRYTAKLSRVDRSTRTTGPLSVFPSVPAVQAQLYPVIARSKGAVSRRERGPRSQVTPKSKGSSDAAESVAPEPLGGPLVRPAHRGRAGEPRPDNVAQIAQVLHDFGSLQGLGDEDAGAGGVHGGLGPERGGQDCGGEEDGGRFAHAVNLAVGGCWRMRPGASYTRTSPYDIFLPTHSPRSRYVPQDSLTITDNRTGRSLRGTRVRGHRPGHGPPPDQGLGRRLRPHDVRPGLHEHGRVPERHHVHRRRPGHPALPRLSDRAAGRSGELSRGGVPPDRGRAADQDAARTSGRSW